MLLRKQLPLASPRKDLGRPTSWRTTDLDFSLCFITGHKCRARGRDLRPTLSSFQPVLAEPGDVGRTGRQEGCEQPSERPAEGGPASPLTMLSAQLHTLCLVSAPCTFVGGAGRAWSPPLPRLGRYG